MIQCEKVIFLDFDGVLATDDYEDSLLEGGKVTHDKYGRLFNPSCVEMLNMIIKRTNAGIVVSSDWRNFLSLWDMVRMWDYRNMPGIILGVTPSVSIYRSEEIDKWLRRHSEVKQYVIIDDMDCIQFSEEQRPVLITTNHFSGLDETPADLAIRILAEPGTPIMSPNTPAT